MKKIKQLIEQNKFTLSILGLVLSLSWNLVTYFNPSEQNPNLVFYQKNVSDAFTLSPSIDSLSVILNGRDIRKSEIEIKVFTIKLINNGKRGIGERDFDSNSSFGIGVNSKGKIIGIKFSDSPNNDSYLVENLKPRIIDSSKVILKNITIPKGSSVKFDLLILCKKGSTPNLNPIGRISDSDIKLTLDEESTSFDWETLLIIILVLVSIPIAFYVLGTMYGFIGGVISLFKGRLFLKRYGYPLNRQFTPDQLAIAEIRSKMTMRNFNKVLNTLAESTKTQDEYLKERGVLAAVTMCNEMIEIGKVRNTNSEKVRFNSIFLTAIDILEKKELITILTEKEIKLKPSVVQEIIRTIKLQDQK